MTPRPAGASSTRLAASTIQQRGRHRVQRPTTRACLARASPFPAPYYCGESVYLRRRDHRAPSSRWPSKATPRPDGRVETELAFDPRINARGDVAFIGDTTPGSVENFGVDVGVYLYDRVKGTTTAGGPAGHADARRRQIRYSLITFTPGNLDLNSRGDVTFGAVLDTDANHDGKPDTGVYILVERNALLLVARSGTVILTSARSGETRPARHGELRQRRHEQRPRPGVLPGDLDRRHRRPVDRHPAGQGYHRDGRREPRAQEVMPLVFLPFTEIDQAIQEFGGGLLTVKKKR